MKDISGLGSEVKEKALSKMKLLEGVLKQLHVTPEEVKLISYELRYLYLISQSYYIQNYRHVES
jgi:hypothetical protein